jgi:D-arabinose 1-dehydrogenase-like Zn-dependent alcohol dehydrogenase
MKPGVLSIEDIPIPKPGDYSVLCRLLYGATCTATDQHIIDQRILTTEMPTILGHESFGVAVEAGRKVRSFRVGDRITRVGAPAMPEIGLYSNWGGYAQYGLAFDDQAMIEDGVFEAGNRIPFVNQRIPDDVPDTAAPMMTTWRETLSYITRMGLSAGMRVLVLGSGGNGLSFLNHARNASASFILGVGSEGRRGNAACCGASEYLDYREADHVLKVAECAGNGYDLIVDAVGHPGQLDEYLPFLADGGTVGIYGIEGIHEMRMNPLRAKHTFRFYQGGYMEGEAHDPVVSFIRAGRLRPEPFYDIVHPYPLDKIAGAFDMLRRGEHPKALIRLND